MGSGGTEAGSILSFAASVFGFGTGWTSYAADYTVYQPVSVSRVKTFAWTWGGLILPLCFTEMLGLAVATATLDPVDTSYSDGYNQSGIGGLLAAVLFPPLGRFGQFCLVILALSIIANNCPNIYSVTFSLQVLGRWTQAVPRFIWTFIGTVIYCAIAIPGYSHFAQVLEDFMLLIVSHPPSTSLPPPFPLYCIEIIQLTRHATGLLARHLRRHLPDRALRLQTAQIRHHHLEQPGPAAARHGRRARLLLRRLRRRHGHGAGVVHRSHRQEDWGSELWGRRRFRVGFCL